MDNLTQKFAKKIKLERARRGWSQMKLAEKANLSLTVMGRIERAEVSTTIENIEKLASCFELMPKDLFNFDDIL